MNRRLAYSAPSHTPTAAPRVIIATVLALSTLAVGVQAADEAVTFNQHVAPILYRHCSACHHPDGAAPFSLLSYTDARQRATQIAQVTARRFMPPWKADDASGPFIGQQKLTASEIDVLQRWAAAGAPEGVGRVPRPPTLARGWQLGQPDLVVSLPGYTLQGEGTDVFRVFVIPLPVSVARYVRGLEFRPGNGRVVHHANIRVDRTRASRRFDDEDPAPGYEGLIAHSATYPDGHFLGWTPGQLAPLLPKGLGWRLDPDTDLVVEVHMQPAGRPETVQPSVGFFFGVDPPQSTPAMLRLGRQSIDIPAEESRYAIADSFVLPVDAEVQAVQPHAHYRAREVRGVATLPDGTIRPLIHIRDWDFRWQHVYRYVSPVALPKGTTLSMQYIFDNSSTNHRNPVVPPRRVFWGQRSSDEMGDLWIQLLTRRDADLAILNQRIMPKVLAEDAVGYERVIASEPESVALHDDAASLYLKLGRAADAVRHFSRSVELRPDSPATHFNLGTALTVAGQLDEAIARYEEALRLRPAYPQAHNNLASILLQRGEPSRALEHLQAAIAADSGNAEAHFNLARAYGALGAFDRAIEAARRALGLNPPEPLLSAVRQHLQHYQQQQRP